MYVTCCKNFNSNSFLNYRYRYIYISIDVIIVDKHTIKIYSVCEVRSVIFENENSLWGLGAIISICTISRTPQSNTLVYQKYLSMVSISEWLCPKNNLPLCWFKIYKSKINTIIHMHYY